MNSSFSNSGLKALNHMLNCLARFGDLLAFHANPNLDNSQASGLAYVRLTVINSSESALCQVFLDDPFFEQLVLDITDKKGGIVIDAQMAVRTFQSVFKSKASSNQLINCELNVIEEGTKSRVEVSLNYDTGLKIKHQLTYEAKRGLIAMAREGPYRIRLSTQATKTWLDQFLNASTSTRFGEVTMWCYDDVCLLKAKHEDLPTIKDTRKRGIQTSLKVAIDDLDIFEVEQEQLLTFSLKEFKAALSLADALSIPLDLRFNEGGDPLFILMATPEGARIKIILATSTNDVTETTDQSGGAQAQNRHGEPQRPNPNVARWKERELAEAQAAAARSGSASTNAEAADGAQSGDTRASVSASGRRGSSFAKTSNAEGRGRTAAAKRSRTLRTAIESQPSEATQNANRTGMREVPMESTPFGRRDTEGPFGRQELFLGGSQMSQEAPPPASKPFDPQEDEDDLDADDAGLEALEEYERATQIQLREQQKMEAEVHQNGSTSNARPRPRPRLAAGAMSSSSKQSPDRPKSNREVTHEDLENFEPLPMDDHSADQLVGLELEDTDLHSDPPVQPRAVIRVAASSAAPQNASEMRSGRPSDPDATQPEESAFMDEEGTQDTRMTESQEEEPDSAMQSTPAKKYEELF